MSAVEEIGELPRKIARAADAKIDGLSLKEIRNAKDGVIPLLMESVTESLFAALQISRRIFNGSTPSSRKKTATEVLDQIWKGGITPSSEEALLLKIQPGLSEPPSVLDADEKMRLDSALELGVFKEARLHLMKGMRTILIPDNNAQGSYVTLEEYVLRSENVSELLFLGPYGDVRSDVPREAADVARWLCDQEIGPGLFWNPWRLKKRAARITDALAQALFVPTSAYAIAEREISEIKPDEMLIIRFKYDRTYTGLAQAKTPEKTEEGRGEVELVSVDAAASDLHNLDYYVSRRKEGMILQQRDHKVFLSEHDDELHAGLYEGGFPMERYQTDVPIFDQYHVWRGDAVGRRPCGPWNPKKDFRSFGKVISVLGAVPK